MSIAYSIRGLLDVNKLTGKNYDEWLRNVRIVLTAEKIAYVLDTTLPVPPDGASEEDIQKFHKWIDDSTLAKCLMLSSMVPELQKQYEDMDCQEILTHLGKLFGACARQERYDISKKLFRTRMSEGSSVQAHVLKMIEWIRGLDKLGFELNDELATDLILQSLPDSFSPFILNFNMNKLEASLDELLNMLVVAEVNMQKDRPSAMIVG